MGDRTDRVRAWRKAVAGAVLATLAVIATAALAVAIPTQGENPRAWGVVFCGLVTVGLCVDLALRSWRLLRHYRGDDLAPRPGDHHHAPHRGVLHHARAKAAR